MALCYTVLLDLLRCRCSLRCQWSFCCQLLAEMFALTHRGPGHGTRVGPRMLAPAYTGIRFLLHERASVQCLLFADCF